jgi:hypothetical protein
MTPGGAGKGSEEQRLRDGHLTAHLRLAAGRNVVATAMAKLEGYPVSTLVSDGAGESSDVLAKGDIRVWAHTQSKTSAANGNKYCAQPWSDIMTSTGRIGTHCRSPFVKPSFMAKPVHFDSA